MLTLNHKNLTVWINSINLVTEIYKLTQSFPKEELYGLTSQLRRAAVSVPSNIAEGSSRTSPVERKRFYEISRSSLVEIDTQIEISLLLEYLSKEQICNLEKETNNVFALLTSLINKTN
jgi:four helix bundle protein